MPKIYEYLGYVFYFYSNEHEPIHVHVTTNGRECVYDIIVENGELTQLRMRTIEHKLPLKSNEQKIAYEFITKYYKKIIAKWINFFVMHKTVKSTVVRTKL